MTDTVVPKSVDTQRGKSVERWTAEAKEREVRQNQAEMELGEVDGRTGNWWSRR